MKLTYASRRTHIDISLVSRLLHETDHVSVTMTHHAGDEDKMMRQRDRNGYSMYIKDDKYVLSTLWAR